MSSESLRPRVLIVGSGPAGLVLALTLAKNGVPFRIIEKQEVPHQSQRGAGVQPRTQEMYKFLEVFEDIKGGSMPALPVANYKFPGGTEIGYTTHVMPPVDPTPDIPDPNIRIIGQADAETILRSHLSRLGIEVEFGTELIDFHQDKDEVTANIVKHGPKDEQSRETVCVDFLVGVDGARGITRKQLGLSFIGETASISWVIGDVFLRGLNTDYWHNWRPSDLEMVFLRPTDRDGLFQAILSAPDPADYPQIMSDKEFLQEFIRKATTRDDIIIDSIQTLSEYRPNIRMVNKFSEGRVFVAGDAAHVHSFTGGQGLNSSMQDAFNLGWKLSLVCKDLSPLSLLDTYNDERFPVIRDMLARTTVLFKKMLSASKDDNEASWNRPRVLAQLGVNYRWSDILVDDQVKDLEEKATVSNAYGAESDGKLRAGDRAPDSPGLFDTDSGKEMVLFSLFKPTHHTVLLFNPSKDECSAILDALATWPRGTFQTVFILPKGDKVANETADTGSSLVRLEDGEGHAYRFYRQLEDARFPVVIVRPDGVVGGIVKGAAGVKAYREKIFV
ncbi:Rifampicin monooxygenase-like protein [Abortiporus biennis]